MNKKLFIVVCLIFYSAREMNAATNGMIQPMQVMFGVPPAPPAGANPVTPPLFIVPNFSTIEQQFAAATTYNEKSTYITSLLDAQIPHIGIAEKIRMAKDLLIVLDTHITLRSGWFLSAEQKMELSWFKEQRARVQAKLDLLDRWFSFPAFSTVAGVSAFWLIAVAIFYNLAKNNYESQYAQYNIDHPDDQKHFSWSYADIAGAPVYLPYQGIKSLVHHGVDLVTGGTTKSVFDTTGKLAQGAWQHVTGMLAELYLKSKEKVIGDSRDAAEYLLQATTPLTPAELLLQKIDNLAVDVRNSTIEDKHGKALQNKKLAEIEKDRQQYTELVIDRQLAQQGHVRRQLQPEQLEGLRAQVNAQLSPVFDQKIKNLHDRIKEKQPVVATSNKASAVGGPAVVLTPGEYPGIMDRLKGVTPEQVARQKSEDARAASQKAKEEARRKEK